MFIAVMHSVNGLSIASSGTTEVAHEDVTREIAGVTSPPHETTMTDGDNNFSFASTAVPTPKTYVVTVTIDDDSISERVFVSDDSVMRSRASSGRIMPLVLCGKTAAGRQKVHLHVIRHNANGSVTKTLISKLSKAKGPAKGKFRFDLPGKRKFPKGTYTFVLAADKRPFFEENFAWS